MNPKLDISSLPLLCQPCFELTNNDFIENANIFTEFGDLTPSQVLTLFDQFINWPEFRECSFNASLDSAMMKFHTNPDDTTISQDLVEEVEEDEEKKNTEEEKF
jgi:dimethyladenosine transferase 2, mitochondrial